MSAESNRPSSDLGAATGQREEVELGLAFGEPVARVTDANWAELAGRLQSYLLRPDRDPVLSFDAIARSLATRWGTPVVETPYPVGSMGPLGDADRDYGRCSVRLLDLFGESKVYLVVRRAEARGERRMLWALLHELGHFVNHFEMLLSLSALYQRVCLNPSLETEVAGFASGGAAALHVRHEVEADLFALDWLLPDWIDSDEEVRRRELPRRLTADGYRFYRLRCTLGSPVPLPSGATAVEALNRAGASERARASRPYPRLMSLWQRAAWVLFNRAEIRAEPPELVKLNREYFAIADYPPRYVPELRAGPHHGGSSDGGAAWIDRVAPQALAREVDTIRWSPMLVPPPDVQRSKFHIPIRPVASRSGRDSVLQWVHMISSNMSSPRSLEEWLQRAHAQDAGLLVFPRNPVERFLDAGGQAGV